jgi:DNA-binding NarL/FixJ family response regulator
MGRPDSQFDGAGQASSAALVRVLVADNAPTRLGIRMALDGFATVCVEAGDRAGAVRGASSSRPDVCLIGRSLVGGGIDAVREIRQGGSGASVVVLADSQEVDDLLLALRAGAIGYLPVDFEPEQLRRVIAAVRSEEAAIPRTMVMDLVDEIRSFERARSGPLTLREMQVLTMLRRGDSTARIAEGLSISPVTVRRHISELVQKAGVRGREELAGAFTEGGARVNI